MPAQPKSTTGPRVLTVRELAVLAGPSDDGLSPAPGRQAARI